MEECWPTKARWYLLRADHARLEEGNPHTLGVEATSEQSNWGQACDLRFCHHFASDHPHANNQWQTYTYDGDGRRVKRNVNGTETWQVYGLGGELLAEYAANAAAASPQKEYGYRNGQLLITAE